MVNNKVSTLAAANADYRTASIAAKPGEHIDNKADDAVEVPGKGGRKIVVLELPSRKKVEEMQAEEAVEAKRTIPETHAD